MQRLSQQTQDQRLQVYLQDFANVVSARIGKLIRPFTSEEALLLSDQQVGMAIRRVWFLTEELKNKVQHGLQFPLDCRRDEGPFWAGFAFKHQQKPLGWLGVWIDAWDGVGKSPLFYQLPETVRRHLQDIVRDATAHGYPGVEQFNDRGTNQMVVPLPIKTGPLNDVVTYLAKVVIGYINLIYPLIP